MTKKVKLISTTFVFTCLVLLGALWKNHVDVAKYKKVTIETRTYVSKIPAGSSMTSIHQWLKNKGLTVRVLKNDPSNEQAHMIISNAHLDEKDVGSYMNSWIEKPITLDDPDERYNFEFYFDRKGNLIKAKTEEYVHHNMDF